MEITGPRQRWSWQPAIAGALLGLGIGLLTSCGEDASTEDSSSATWVIGPSEQVSGETTGFTAVVTRLGCGSGVDGEPEVPEIDYSEDEVRITFRISPRIDNGTCEGTLGVSYKVKLDEPLGSRSLVDGECHPGSTAWTTAFCLEEGVRYSPR